MIRICEIGKCIVMRRNFHSRIIDLQLFQRLGVVVNNHTPGTHNGHLADLLWIEPAVVNESASVLAKLEMHHGDVLNSARNVAAALAGHTRWHFVQEMKQYGNIVRSQIPRDVDIFLEQSEVE